MASRSKVVITGASGFTGKHLKNELEKWKKEISIDNKYLSLTKEGIPFLDSILPDLFI